MPFETSPAATGWSARLALRFAARAGATVLAQRRHHGPLRVQKPLYPEGPRACHAIVVHPPAGIAGGDDLAIDLTLDDATHVLITTPGAGKWYRSAGPDATQSLTARLAGDAVLEWLPQEAIVYDGARMRASVEATLSREATLIAQDVLCFGRTASGERFARGRCALATRVERDGALLWLERGQVEAGSAFLASPVGLDGQPVVATLLAASPRASPDLVAACREVRCAAGRGAVTLLPGIVVARWLGPACEPARAWLAALWNVLRPALCGCAPCRPRIWNT